MRKILFVFIFSIILLSNVSLGATLIDNLNSNKMSMPFYLTSTCNHETTCFVSTTSGTINGQSIKLDESFGTIESIKILLKRDIINTGLPNNNATITLKVYTSIDDTPSSSKYLWDSVTFNPTSSFISSYSLTFDYEIPVYNENDVYTTKWLWIELYENTTGTILQYNPIYYGFYQAQNNKYIPSDLYQYYGTSWTTIESHYNPSWYSDIAFALYGTYHTPPFPTVVPTDTSTNPDSPPCYVCNGSIPSPDEQGNTSWNPDFNDTSIPCNDCIGNETENPFKTIPSESNSGKVLKGFGYCNSRGCSIYDLIDFLYDISIFMFWLSIAIILIKWWTIWRK